LHHMSQTKDLVSTGYDVAHIQPNADVCVRQDRTIFNHRAAVDIAVFLDTAKAGDQRVLLHFRSTADVGRCNDTRSPMDFSSLLDPDARFDFATRGTHRATSAKSI